MSASHNPENGPDLYAARRQRWLTPPGDEEDKEHHVHPAFASLQQTMERPGAITDEDVWKRSIERIHRHITAGQKVGLSGLASSWLISLV